MACKEDRKPAGIPSSKRPRSCDFIYLSESDDEGENPRVPSSQSATLIDLSIFDCPICSEPLLSTVYQCENGHIACPPCCIKMENKCPTCRTSPIGTIRCKGLEKVLRSVTVICPNMLYGCPDTFKLDRKLHHDEVCSYNKPCTCPHENCDYVGMPEPLFSHFGEVHSPSQFSFDAMKSVTLDSSHTRVFLQDSSRSTLFVLKLAAESGAGFFSVACVGPDSMRSAFSYCLAAAAIDGKTSVTIKAEVVCVRKWTPESVLGKCIALPMDMVDKRGELDIGVIIRKKNPI